MNFTRISIASLNKKSLKDIVNVVNDEIVRLPSHFKYIWGYIATLGTIKSNHLNQNDLKLLKSLQMIYATSNFLKKEFN